MLTLTGMALQGLGDRFAELRADGERGAIVSTEAAGVLAVVVAIVAVLVTSSGGWATEIGNFVTDNINEVFDQAEHGSDKNVEVEEP